MIAFAACGPQRAATPEEAEVIGIYQAENKSETVEKFQLFADGRFTFLIVAVGGDTEACVGQWSRRGEVVILTAKDTSGRDVEFPLSIDRATGNIALIYSEESYAAAPADMIHPNSFRRIGAPNQSPGPMSGTVKPTAKPAAAPVPPAARP